MELQYQVPKSAYVALLAQMIRRNDRRPLRRFMALLLTAGQMAVVILLCIFRLEGKQRLFFLLWSVLLAGITILRRCTVRQRAAGTLRRLEYSGQLPEDYWKKHMLRQIGQELRLSYGAQRLSCPVGGVTRIEETEDVLELYCDNTIFDLIPFSAFDSKQARQQFVQQLRETAAKTELPEKKAQTLTNASLCWSMEEKTFLEGQYNAYRTLYYRYRFLRPATFMRLAMSVIAVIGLMQQPAPITVVLCIVVLLVANLENISMIPMLCRRRISQEIGAWRGSKAYRLKLQGETLLFASELTGVHIPLSQINLCEQCGAFYVIAWKNFPAVVVPIAVWQSVEATELAATLETLSIKK